VHADMYTLVRADGCVVCCLAGGLYWRNLSGVEFALVLVHRRFRLILRMRAVVLFAFLSAMLVRLISHLDPRARCAKPLAVTMLLLFIHRFLSVEGALLTSYTPTRTRILIHAQTDSVYNPDRVTH